MECVSRPPPTSRRARANFLLSYARTARGIPTSGVIAMWHFHEASGSRRANRLYIRAADPARTSLRPHNGRFPFFVFHRFFSFTASANRVYCSGWDFFSSPSFFLLCFAQSSFSWEEARIVSFRITRRAITIDFESRIAHSQLLALFSLLTSAEHVRRSHAILAWIHHPFLHLALYKINNKYSPFFPLFTLILNSRGAVQTLQQIVG